MPPPYDTAELRRHIARLLAVTSADWGVAATRPHGAH